MDIRALTKFDIDKMSIEPEEEECDLGVTLDRHLDMNTDINNIWRSAYLAIRSIGKIRNYLDETSTKRLVHAILTTKLDFCNSVLYCLPKKNIDKLQHVLNLAARIITRSRKHKNITPILNKLHRLPMDKRIVFKIVKLAFKIVNNIAPSYLSELLKVHQPKHILRSSSSIAT